MLCMPTSPAEKQETFSAFAPAMLRLLFFFSLQGVRSTATWEYCLIYQYVEDAVATLDVLGVFGV